MPAAKDTPPKPRGRPRKSAQPAEPETPPPAAESAAPVEPAPPAEPAGSGDKPPTPPAAEQPKRKRTRTSKKERTRQLENALAEILTLPAVPAAMTGDQWLYEHFSTQGPETAAKLAAASENNQTLRRILEQLTQGEGYATLVMAGMAYLLPPLLYFGVVPVPALKSVFSVPERGAREHPAAAPAPEREYAGDAGAAAGTFDYGSGEQPEQP